MRKDDLISEQNPHYIQLIYLLFDIQGVFYLWDNSILHYISLQ